MIIRSFKKCGIAVQIDGSEDDQININGLDDYKVEQLMRHKKYFSYFIVYKNHLCKNNNFNLNSNSH